jgi:hypothetical protein
MAEGYWHPAGRKGAKNLQYLMKSAENKPLQPVMIQKKSRFNGTFLLTGA